MNDILLHWVLPSLTVFFVFLQILRIYGTKPADIDLVGFIALVALCAVWPLAVGAAVGLILFKITKIVGDLDLVRKFTNALMKER